MLAPRFSILIDSGPDGLHKFHVNEQNRDFLRASARVGTRKVYEFSIQSDCPL